VALFNILQEGDVQIRGFKLWLPLDIQFVFTANPEDYTNRGSIVTPLKDRIDSQIITHYPKSIEIGKKITQQEAKRKDGQSKIFVNDILQNLIEKVAIEARNSEFVDAKSGVSARMTISAFENLLSSAELRALKNGDKKPSLRVSDIYGAISAINGKIELVYEGELEGPVFVAHNLIGKAIRSEFIAYFPNPEKRKSPDYKKIVEWFGDGNSLTFLSDESQKVYKSGLKQVHGLGELVESFFPNESSDQKDFLMEFVLHGMAEYSLISKQSLDEGVKFNDLLDSMLSKEDFE
jgi:magnesium chelatase subunit I